MNTCCVVVIGHVDHGKTSLVHALTGIETDRLPEEKVRGLSIAPGFAHCAYPEGTVDFIDAPGHADFIQAMVAGASGARAVLVVVSAVEGVAAQTLEHLRIAELLGITSGIIALTKADLLSGEQQELRSAEIRAVLAGTPFAAAPMMSCSAITGAGMGDLHAGVQELLRQDESSTIPHQSFLPIDRVFSLAGLGTIVTGTLLGHALATDKALTVQPQGLAVSVRGLQSRGKDRAQVQTGERVAVNLRGVAVADIARGSVLCEAAAASNCLDVRLDLSGGSAQALKHMDSVRILFGTSSEVAQVRLFGGGRLSPSDGRFAQLRFGKPVVAYAGQRAVVRRLSPPETIGGAHILDPLATGVKAGDKLRLNVLEVVETKNIRRIAAALIQQGRGVASVEDIARLSRVKPEDVPALLNDRFAKIHAGQIADTHMLEMLQSELLVKLAEYHCDHPLKAMAPASVNASPKVAADVLRHVEAQLMKRGEIIKAKGQIALSDHDPFARMSAVQRDQVVQLETVFRDAALAPPSFDAVTIDDDERAILALLKDTGRLISLENVALKQVLTFHADALDTAAALLRECFPAQTVFTTSQARTALGTSRRIIVPVLEYFDANGVTVRTGDARHIVDPNDV